jgi:Tfp pilus assembly protein PilV
MMWLRLAKYGGAVLLVVIGLLAFSQWRYQAGFSAADTHWQAKWSSRDAADATALAKRQAQNREEEQREQSNIDHIRTQAEQQLAQVKADADTARAAADRLHDSAETLARRLADREKTCHPRTAATGTTVTTGSELLAELFRRADQRAGELASLADQARARGLACEMAYDAVRTAQK